SEGEDWAWAVFDGEEHYANNQKNWYEALDLARRKDIRLAISNPCFELWYLLHFQDHNAFVSRDVICRLLERWIEGYHKAHILYPDPLAPLTSEATTRARNIAAYAQRNDLKLHDHLCAEGVADLVELLLSLVRRA